MHKLFKRFKRDQGKTADHGSSTESSSYFVAVSLQHRGRLSLGENRQRLVREAYHWGILVIPAGSEAADKADNCVSFDASDGAALDPVTGIDLNEDRNWLYRARRSVNPFANGNLLGRVVVGHVGEDTSLDRLEALLRTVPLPAKEANPKESCVTWTLAALSTMQSAGILQPFDVEAFADRALLYGDFCLANINVHNIRDRTEIMQDESLRQEDAKQQE